jgi:lipoyl synthase
MGFLYAASGPLVRSSYRAAEVFLRSLATPPAVTLGELSGSLVTGATGSVTMGETSQPPAHSHDPAWVDAMLRARLEEARRAARRVSDALGDPKAPGRDGGDPHTPGRDGGDPHTPGPDPHTPGPAGRDGGTPHTPGPGLVPAASLVRRA